MSLILKTEKVYNINYIYSTAWIGPYGYYHSRLSQLAEVIDYISAEG